MNAIVKGKVRRGTSNKNVTGSSADRRARRQWLLDVFGDGVTCPCYRCEESLTLETLTVDRRRAGMDGGGYERGNIHPACATCNILTGLRLMHHRKKFPYLGLVRFKSRRICRSPWTTPWEVVRGEGELFLVLRSTISGRMKYGVDRALIEHIPGAFAKAGVNK